MATITTKKDGFQYFMEKTTTSKRCPLIINDILFGLFADLRLNDNYIISEDLRMETSP